MAVRKQSRSSARAGSKSNARQGVSQSLVNDETEDFEGEYLGISDNNDDSENDALPDLTLDSLPKSTDTALYSYLQRNDLINEEYYTTLYKFDRDHGELKTFCERLTGDIPTEDYIGRKYGGGRYCIVLQVQDKTGKVRGTTKKIRIHKMYDNFLNNNPQSNMMFPAINLSQGNGGNTLQDAVNLIRVMMSTFMPFMKMMQISQAPASAPQSDNVAEMLKDNYRAMNEAMKEMMLDNTQLFNDFSRRQADLPETTESEDETTGVIGMLNSLFPMIEKLLPVITMRGSQGMQAVNTIKKLPQYNQVIKDKQTIKKLYDFIVSKHGEDTARQVLRRFKIKSPYNKTVKKEGAK